MARGWESKSIESQIDDASVKPARLAAVPLAPAERDRLHRRDTLSLSRTRVLAEIARCTNSRFRAQLESELQFLECELSKLNTI